MKKFIAALVFAIVSLTAVCSLAACTKTSNVKVKEIELTSEDYAFAISKDNPTLLAQVNGYLAEWKADGSMEALINSYFDGSAQFSYTNKSSAPKADDFIVATNAYFPPFESIDKKSAFYGVDIEIAYSIAQKLNKTLYISDMEFDAIIPSVKTGKSHIGMAGITVNDTRKEQVDFASGYYTSAQVITVAENNTLFDDCTTTEEIEAILKAQNKNFKIGTQTGTTGFMYSNGDADFGYEGFKNLTTLAYSTGALAMKDLKNGKISAVILDKQPSLMIASSINK